jgi:hypothetical protein
MVQAPANTADAAAGTHGHADVGVLQGEDVVGITTGDTIPDRRLVQADQLIDDRPSLGRLGHAGDRVVVC